MSANQISSKTKIGLLVAAHFAAGVSLASAVQADIARVGWLALVLADAGLMGIWGGLGTTRIAWRVPMVFAMTSALSAICITAMRAWDNAGRATVTFVLVALPTALICGVLCRLRLGRRRLRFARLSNVSPTCEGFQFSIRHLFLATTAVAIILAIGREMRTDSISVWAATLAVATFTPCVIMVELATLWAALGIGRPALRLAAVLPTAFVVGLIPPFYTEEPVRSKLATFVIFSVIFGLQATILAISLLVFRSCGWRLVSGDRSTP